MRIGIALAVIAAGSLAVAKPYTVKQGDTLYSIAKTHGVKLPTLMMLNRLSDDSIKGGQVLTLPDSAAPAAKTVSAARPAQQPVARSRDGSIIVRAAYQKVGSAYRWGATGPNAFDCSGFVNYVFKQFGVSLPRTSAAIARTGTPIPASSLIEGDLLFYATRGGTISHIGIYIGNRRMIHASTPRTGVIISGIDEPYYRQRYAGARRVL
jgi:cell wall-associated NlpC family hydrolase